MKKLIASLLFMPIMANAAFKTGNELLSDINAPDLFTRGLALGYIMSAADMARGVWFCPPADGAGITAGQIQDLIKAYLSANPSVRNKPADFLLIQVFSAWYPCQNNKGRGA